MAPAVNKLQNFPEGTAERRDVLFFRESEQFVFGPEVASHLACGPLRQQVPSS